MKQKQTRNSSLKRISETASSKNTSENFGSLCKLQLTRLSEIEQNSKTITETFQEYQGDVKELKGIIAQQQATIDTLLRMLPKNDQ